jgi:RNA polymerase sigma-54 factor
VLRQTVQAFEPAGVGARDLVECLSLQLDDCHGHDEAVIAVAQRLLSHQEATLLAPDSSIAEQFSCTENTVMQARKLLRQLDPSPGLAQADPSIYIEPELSFILQRDGNLTVEVRRNLGGCVRLSQQWDGHVWQGDDETFMSNAEKEARWLLHALSQRHDTLLKTGLFLASYQQGFLMHGAAAIKPLTLKQVAEACDVHESTISRLTSNKYAYTPLGLIELRNFFSAGLETRHGDTIAVPQVLRRIKHMIEKENPAKPLSDQAIFKQLGHEGITIARRTIAKYREQLGFPSSTKRRQR